MNEKIFCSLSFIFAVLLFSCSSTSGVYDNGVGAGTIRDTLSELGEQQTDSALTSSELKGAIERSLEKIGRLEQAIEDGAGDIKEFKKILKRVRERGTKDACRKSSAD